MKKNRNLCFEIEDILRIALFDFWVANIDRTPNNPNLLVEQKQKINIYAIDHGQIFDGNSGLTLETLTIDESILGHDIFRLANFDKKTTLKKFKEVLALFDNLVNRCEKKIDSVLADIPNDWNLDINEIRNYTRSNIFNKKWLL